MNRSFHEYTTDVGVLRHAYSITITFEGGISHKYSKIVSVFSRSYFIGDGGERMSRIIQKSYWERDMVVTPPPNCPERFTLKNDVGEFTEAELIYKLWNELFPCHTDGHIEG